MEIWKSIIINKSCRLLSFITLRTLINIQHLTHIQYKASALSSHTYEVLTENAFMMPVFVSLISNNSTKYIHSFSAIPLHIVHTTVRAFF